VPFVVVRQAVAATTDMGVGHAGLIKLCRFTDIEQEESAGSGAAG